MKEYRVDETLRNTLARFAYFLMGFGILLTIAPFALLLFKSSKPELWEMLLIPILVIAGLSQLMFPSLLLWQLRDTHILVSPDGITYTSPSMALKCAWYNLERIRENGQYNSLVLRKPVELKCAWWSRLFSRQAVQEIPLSWFPGWQGKELGQEIKRYAPHLFAEKP
jgi:hypothetical protein